MGSVRKPTTKYWMRSVWDMLERSKVFYSLRHKKNEGENGVHLGENVKDIDF